MKIAIATEKGAVSPHFGRCPAYTIVDLEEGRVKHRSEIPNPGHRPGFLPEFLSSQGVDVIVAGGMGPRAQELFQQKNIVAYLGIQGSIDDVIADILHDRLEAGEDLCDHQPDEKHSCDETESERTVTVPAGARICLSAAGSSRDAEIDPRFGRAACFLFLDPSTQQLEAIPNPYRDAAQGAGVRSAQMMVNKRVRIVLTGRVGPKADLILQAAGVKIIPITFGTVHDALRQLEAGGD